MTQSIYQSLMFNVLRQVSLDRLQRAVNAVVENTASVTLTRTTDTEIRALVRNGEGHEYGVALTETGVFCSCRDALYRGQVCQHATLLALLVLRTIPQTKEVPRLKSGHIYKVASRLSFACGVSNGHNAIP
jgi:hypothetical protein